MLGNKIESSLMNALKELMIGTIILFKSIVKVYICILALLVLWPWFILEWIFSRNNRELES